MKKVLVLVDNIQQLSNNIDFVLKQYQFGEMEITLAYILPPIVDLMLEGENPLVTDFEKRIDTQRVERPQLIQRISDFEKQGLRISLIEIDGTKINNLIKVVKEEDFDLIIMNSEGRSWLKDKITGSPWSSLINQVKTPLFIIPASNKPAISRI